MICKKCGDRCTVADVRHSMEEDEIFRKQVCKSCGNVFFTVEYEVIENEKFNEAWKASARSRSDKVSHRKG